MTTAVGDEGGFAPTLHSHEEAIELIVDAIEQAGYVPGKDVFIGLDCASSEFYEDGVYNLKGQVRHLLMTNGLLSSKNGVTNIQSSPSKTVWPKAIGKDGPSLLKH